MKILSLLTIILFFSSAHVSVEEQFNFELVVFEGSDWCPNCRQFDNQILSDKLFQEYLEKENIKLTKVDFPQRKKLSKEQEKINKDYAEKYQFIGVFPTIILSRIDSLSYQNLSYTNHTPDQFIRQIADLLETI